MHESEIPLIINIIIVVSIYKYFICHPQFKYFIEHRMESRRPLYVSRPNDLASHTQRLTIYSCCVQQTSRKCPRVYHISGYSASLRELQSTAMRLSRYPSLLLVYMGHSALLLPWLFSYTYVCILFLCSVSLTLSLSPLLLSHVLLLLLILQRTLFVFTFTHSHHINLESLSLLFHFFLARLIHSSSSSSLAQNDTEEFAKIHLYR